MLNHNMTSQDLKVNSTFICNKCKDTSWIETESRTFKRCECYSLDLAKRLWNKFGVKPSDVKKLNDYTPYDEFTSNAKVKAIEYIKNYKKESLGLFGQAGSGKTHIVVAIGAALISREPNPIPVVYMPYIEIMRELKSNAMDEDAYNKIIWKYQTADLLIIDDLFKDKVKNGQLIGVNGRVSELSEADMKHIYPIINYRYSNKLPMLISSECTPDMLMQLDEALAGRILEMCANNIIVFKSSKYNYRLKNFMKEGS